MRIWVMREEERRCLWFTHTHTCAVCVVGREDARRRKKERKEVQVSGGHRPFFLLDTHANNTFHPSQPTADWLEEEENAPGNNGADGPAFVQITVRQPRLSLSPNQRIHPANKNNNNNNRIIDRPTFLARQNITGPHQLHSSNQTTNSTNPAGMFTLNHTHISQPRIEIK
jgi:hypothetical protein